MTDASRVNMDGLWQEMAGAGLDAVVALSPHNFLYVAGVQMLTQKTVPDLLAGVVVAQGGDPVAVVFYVEEAVTRQESWVEDIRLYELGDREDRLPGSMRRSHLEVLADVLRQKGLARGKIGVEKDWLPVRYFEGLKALLPQATLAAADDAFNRARAIKTPDEIEILQRAARATEKAILESFRNASVGSTEKKVADDMRARLFAEGADDVWMTLGAGLNVKVFHQRPGGKQLMPGEPVHFDCGGVFDGYYSDIARMAVVAGPDDQQRSRYRWLYDCMRSTIDRVRPGATGGDLYDGAKAAYDQAGYPIWSELVGHGIGVTAHEWPVFHTKDPTVLEPGMVITIEQGLDDGYGSRFHIEDLVLVTEGAPLILSDYAPSDEPVIID